MKNYLIVGAGGIGMSALAVMLIQNENSMVYGIDENKLKYDELKRKGIKMCYELEEVKWEKIEEIIYSSAIKQNNRVFEYANRFGINVKRRAEKLVELMNLYEYIIGVTGTHGKTTTSSLISHIFIESGKKASSYVGGILLNYGSNFVNYGKDFLIAELDESDGYLSNMSVNASVITNIELEHIDYYKSIDVIGKVYLSFVKKIKDDGYVVLGDIPNKFLRSIKFKKDKIIILNSNDSLFELKTKIKERKIVIDGNYIKVDNNTLSGNYNLSNVALASACAYIEGISIENIQKAVRSFKGVKRRFEIVRDNPKIVISDYAHHPTEIKAVVSNAKELFANKKIIFIFQPHRISRFKTFFNDFANSFENCDEVVVTDIYPAGEEGDIERLPKKFIEKLKKEYSINAYFSKINDINTFLKDKFNADVYIFLGAGSIDIYARKF